MGRGGPFCGAPKSPDLEVVSGGRGKAMAAGAKTNTIQGKTINKFAIILLESAGLRPRISLANPPGHLPLIVESWRCI
jgi:hypothetical protein